MNPSLLALARSAALFALLLSTLRAQTAPAPSAKDADDEAVILSPFVVSSTTDVGYQANDTLTGTRIRSSLADIATTIQVVTKEMMRDTGASNAQDLLVYTTGTEVKGPGGNVALASTGFRALSEDNTRGQFGASNRVRGLASADVTRNLFQTDVPFDTYNTDRIEINRGANASLFGLGSPAGIINQSVNIAEITRSFGEVELRADSNEGTRASFNANHVVIPGELALRVAGLSNRGRYEQEEAFTNDERLFLAATYSKNLVKNSRLIGRTTLRANFETIKINENSPNILPPVDGLSTWFTGFDHALLKNVPTKGRWRNSTDAAVFWAPPLGATPNPRQQFWVVQAASNRGPLVIVPDGNAVQPSAGFVGTTPVVGRQPVINNAVLMPGGGYSTGILVAPTLLPEALNFSTPAVPEWTLYQAPTMRDTSIFDFRNHVLLGPNRPVESDFKVYNVTLEQTFLENKLGFELAYDRQEAHREWSELTQSGITSRVYIDINGTFADGSPNPNFGRPYVAGMESWGVRDSVRSAKRLTGYLSHNFAEHSDSLLARVAGRHTLTGVYTSQQVDSTDYNGGVRVNAEYDQFGRANTVADWESPMIVYLGPDISGRNSAAGAHIPAVGRKYHLSNDFIGNGQFLFKNQTGGSTPQLARTTFNDRWVSGGNKTRQKFDSTAFILQSFLLKELLVGTMSWRSDDVESWVTGAPLKDNRQNSLVYDPTWVPENYRKFNGNFVELSEESTSYGFVLKAPESWLSPVPLVNGVSLSYNQSSNFQVAGSRRDVFGASLGAPTGGTEDYGLRLQMLENKLAVNVTRYETDQANVGFGGGFSLSRFLSSVVRVVDATRIGQNPDANGNFLPENAAGAEISLPKQVIDLTGFQISPTGTATFAIPSDYASTQDIISKGTEIEVIYNPTRSWRFALNVAQQKAEISNVQRSEKLLWEAATINVGGAQKTVKEAWSNDFANLVANTNGIPAPAGGLKSEFSNELNNTLAAGQALNGQRSPELREWRANLITNYEFRTGRMTGVSLGGAIRWEDKAAIGGPVVYLENGTPVTDIAHPYYGPSETRLDLWVGYSTKIFNGKVGWTLQLNVRNALDETDLIPIYANPDGYAAVERIPSGRTFLVTSRFSF